MEKIGGSNSTPSPNASSDLPRPRHCLPLTARLPVARRRAGPAYHAGPAVEVAEVAHGCARQDRTRRAPARADHRPVATLGSRIRLLRCGFRRTTAAPSRRRPRTWQRRSQNRWFGCRGCNPPRRTSSTVAARQPPAGTTRTTLRASRTTRLQLPLFAMPRPKRPAARTSLPLHPQSVPITRDSEFLNFGGIFLGTVDRPDRV